LPLDLPFFFRWYKRRTHSVRKIKELRKLIHEQQNKLKYILINSDHRPGVLACLVAALRTVNKRFGAPEVRNFPTDKGLNETETKSAEELALDDEHGRFGFTIDEAANIVIVRWQTKR
jgi:hypothetical protein